MQGQVQPVPQSYTPAKYRTFDSVGRVQRLTIRMMFNELDIYKETIHQILHDDLSMRKLGAKLVPKSLSGAK